MAGFPKQALDGIVSMAKKGVEKIDLDAVKDSASKSEDCSERYSSRYIIFIQRYSIKVAETL